MLSIYINIHCDVKRRIYIKLHIPKHTYSTRLKGFAIVLQKVQHRIHHG